MKRRRLILLLVVLLVIAAGGYTAFWYYAAALVEGGLADWTAQRRAEGYTVEYAPPEIDGYPLAIRVRVARPLVAAPAFVWQWSGELVAAETRPWAFRRITIRPAGWHQFNFVVDGRPRQAAARADRVVGDVVYRLDGTLESAVIDARGLEVASPDAGGTVTAAAARIEAHPRPAPDRDPAKDLLAVKATFDDLVLTDKLAGALGREVDWLTLDAVIKGAVPTGPPAEALAAWRARGGEIEVRGFNLGWGPLKVDSRGTLALDKELQPTGRFTAKIRGFRATIDALVAAGLVRANDGKLAKGVLGLLARRPDGGGEPELTTRITTRNRILYAGPVGLVRIPRLRWAN